MEEIKIRQPKANGDEIWVTDFTAQTAQEFRERLLEESQENPLKPIIVYIDSYGGHLDALASMIATLDEIPNPIITACYGCAMSCGAILLSHGDMRFCDPHARVMVHRVSAATWGDSDDMKNDVAEIDRLNKYWLGFLALNSNMAGGYNELESLMKSKDGKDRYLTAQEARDMGIIDVVGRPKLNQVTLYEVVSGPDKISIQKRAKFRAEYREENEPKKKTIKKKTIKKKTRRAKR